MLALAYDAALRREELCSLRTDDLDPAHRTLRVRAETTKNRLERVVPYSASTGVLMSACLAHRATVSRARGRCSFRSPGATTGSRWPCGPGRRWSAGSPWRPVSRGSRPTPPVTCV
ncbi:tyrosine-type recombinase/integrase [Streptomyces sp. NPDC088246]|uniref:tyrosine-type recombinase/integrase n=1 Tax=Streptomyces sp. NPDC088246 TaxID=3365842 RepID=UPI00380C3198